MPSAFTWILAVFGPPLAFALVRGAFNFIRANAKRLETLEAVANAVMTNHLPHMQASLDVLNDSSKHTTEQIAGLREDFRTYFIVNSKNE